MDASLIAPGAPFRIFGKNLLLAGYTPIVNIGGQTAIINAAKSTETILLGTVPAGLPEGAATVTVDNGNGSGASKMVQPVAVIAGSGADPFSLDVGWASGFTAIASVVIDPTTDTHVNPRMVADGVTDNTDALQAAIDYASAIGGGTIDIPVGAYLIEKGSLQLKSNVVIKGAGKSATTLNYTGARPIYSLHNDRVGLANLTLSTATSPNALYWNGNSRSFLKNLAISFKTSTHVFTEANVNLAIEDCNFSQSGPGVNGQGVQWLAGNSGLIVTGNTYQFLTGLAFSVDGSQDAYIANNTIIWDGSMQNKAGGSIVTHGVTTNFLKRATIDSNTFKVVNGPIVNHNRNDGEALLSEGGGAGRTETVGTATSATSTTLTDAKNNLNRSDSSGITGLSAIHSIIIISGTGTGQKRDIIGYSGHTMTVDRPWDVVPDTSSRYMTAVMSIENVIISNNRFSQWPRGTWVYFAATDGLDIINNTYTEGGGILLRAESSAAVHDTLLNINVAGNRVINTTHTWGSYFMLAYVADTQNSPDGLGAAGVVFKNNDLQANNPNYAPDLKDVANFEGYGNFFLAWMPPGPYAQPAMGGIIGTIFQGNTCTNCSAVFRTGTNVFAGAYVDTLLKNSSKLVVDSYLVPGAGASQGAYTH
ncbi:glycosyl hydrolase family 28-related protein [Candidatus Methylospira mobilis]|nr:glycosyl hydrolase family 28-related protein [Candidatus Methylospira mobilis]WNV03057.1 glycosyl hydrolase family 28-related protein [Candidatus Methylospira mobilis]